MTDRQKRVDALIHEYVGDIIHREIEFPEGVMVTVAGVQSHPDLKSVEVGVSVFPEKFRGTALKILRKKAGLIQREVNTMLKMKYTPKIEFSADIGTGKATGIEALLDEIKKEF